MKILMIDDTKNPCDFSKEDGIKFTREEITLEKTYFGGRNQLYNNGPWDILLLDWDLGESRTGLNGLTLLEGFAFLVGLDTSVGVKRIIIISRDIEACRHISDLCELLMAEGNLNHFEVQAEYGRVINP
jgi:hypothetical protein